MNLSKNVSVDRVANAAAAGQTDVTSSAVDMQGVHGALFQVLLGAITATGTVSVKAQQSDASGSGYTDLTGAVVAATDADGNKVLLLDVYRPTKRYVRVVVTRATANSVVDGILVTTYEDIKKPVSQGANVAATKLSISPAEA